MVFRHPRVLLRSSLLRYLVVGVGSLVIDYGLLLFSYHVLGFELAVAATLGFLVGLIANFIMNKLWSFQETSRSVKRSLYQLTLYGALVVFNLLFTNLFIVYVDQFGIGPEFSKIITTALTTLWNFILYKKVIFRSPKNTSEPTTPLS